MNERRGSCELAARPGVFPRHTTDERVGATSERKVLQVTMQ